MTRALDSAPFLSVTRFRSDDPSFESRAAAALSVLGEQRGFVRGRLARSTDSTADWMLVTEWQNIGSYRRALGAYAVKVRATPLLGEAVDEPSSYETLVELRSQAPVRTFASDREPADAGQEPRVR